jgi:uncharacterized protein (DUF302 family)
MSIRTFRHEIYFVSGRNEEAGMHFFSKTINVSFEEAIAATRQALERQGFEVFAEIDMQRAFKKTLAVDFRPYRVLGAYHPALAHRAIQVRDEIGSIMLCNIVVQRRDDDCIKISAVDLTTVAYATNNVELRWIVLDLRDRLQNAIKNINAKPVTQHRILETNMSRGQESAA